MKNKIHRVTKNISNKSRRWLIAALCCSATASAMAQGTDPATGSDLGTDIAGFLAGFAQAHAWLTTALLIVGGLRVVFKPVMSLLDAFVKNNCSAEEYNRLRNFESGTVYKWISFALDFVGSVKLPVIGIKPAQTAASTETVKN